MSKLYVGGYGPRRKSHSLMKRVIIAVVAVVAIFLIGLYAAVALFPPKGVAILEYHKVNDWSDDEYTVPTKEFAEQMDELKRQGYTTISILDFLRAKKGKQQLPEKAIIVTFDDGYKDNLTDMLPIMNERGMTATVFMVTNDIGMPGYLTWDDLRELEANGIEIGSHTCNHLPLTEMSPDEANDELIKSKLIMEWTGLKTIFTLSYPNGKYNDRMPELLKKNEYLAAVTGDSGLNTFETNPYLLHRINVVRPHLGLTEFRFRLWKAKAFALLGIFKH